MKEVRIFISWHWVVFFSLIFLALAIWGCGAGDLARTNPFDPKNPANQGKK